jgi:hypothetical protein
VLYVGPSERRDAWQRALIAADGTLLEMLALDDEPGAALFELATYVNAPGLEARFDLVEPVVARVRRELGWQQREVDLGLMRWIRRSACLSVVLGAGATMAAGGPSWSKLVRVLLQSALEEGHQLTEDVVTEQTETSRTVERRTVGVEHFAPEAEEHARRVLAAIERHGASTDVDELQAGAQLCSDLWGQELFMHLTGVLYSSCKAPGPIHRAIAELGRWDAVITYNFDDLAGEAFDECELPRAVWAMSAGEMKGDPNALAQESDWHQRIFHLHGYTPRKLFRITDSEFVFSTHQYAERYGRDYEGVLAHVLHAHLARPVHAALYVGCSFEDEEMNNLLRRAHEELPGRYHFAMLRWPERLDGRTPSAEAVAEQSQRYLDMGVQPVWFEDFDELPALIGALR